MVIFSSNCVWFILQKTSPTIYWMIIAPLWKSGGYKPRFEKVGAILDLPWPFVILWFRNLSNENFSSHFSQELWRLEDWNLVHTWTVGRNIVYTGIRLMLLICPSISSFFFLSNFQTSKIFITLFSGTVKPRRLILDTHVDSGQMYPVY